MQIYLDDLPRVIPRLKSRGVYALLLLLLPGLLAAATFGDPRGFLATEQVAETLIHPGVKYIRAEGTHLGKPMVTHVATIDMATLESRCRCCLENGWCRLPWGSSSAEAGFLTCNRTTMP